PGTRPPARSSPSPSKRCPPWNGCDARKTFVSTNRSAPAGIALFERVIIADALHTQRGHVDYLHETGAGLCFTVRENQPGLFAVLDTLPWSDPPSPPVMSTPAMAASTPPMSPRSKVGCRPWLCHRRLAPRPRHYPARTDVGSSNELWPGSPGAAAACATTRNTSSNTTKPWSTGASFGSAASCSPDELRNKL